MTHEPECFAYDDTGMPYGSTSPECVCEIARAAYQRGREDAAEAIYEWKRKNLRGHQFGCSGRIVSNKFECSCDIPFNSVIAAARGVGEQA